MSKTYTFPQLNLLSGTFDITIITSQGSGSASVTEKYFSNIEPLVKETDVYGGLLRNDAIRFTIGFDKDNYFRDTLFDSFDDVGGWVDILIQSGSVYQFWGTIDATTISSNRFYSDASTHEEITFDAHWVLKRLEKSKVEALENLFSTATATQGQNSGGTAYVYLLFVTDIIKEIFNLLKTLTGLTTVNISYLFAKYGAISKDAFASSTADIIPSSSNLVDGQFEGDQEYIPIENLLVVWKYTDGTKTDTLWDSADTRADISFYNWDNVYEVLIDILKSFGMILTIDSITLTQLNVTIKDRTDGSLVVPTQMLESRKNILTTEYLESITTSPKGNNLNQPEYEFELKANFGSSFNYTTAFKTKGAYTDGDTDYKNYLSYRNYYSGAFYVFGVKDIMEGARKNSNWHFADADALTGWTTGVVNGATIAHASSATDNHTPSTSGSGVVAIQLQDVATSSAYMQTDVTDIDYEITVICWVKITNLGSWNASTSLRFYVSIYDSSSVFLTPENASTEYDKSFTNSTKNGLWRMMTFRVRPKKDEHIKYVRITANGISPILPMNIRLDDVSIYRSHQYFHGMLGNKMMRYYSRPNNKIQNKYNGIVSATCGDNFLDNGETFYIKKIAKDYQNNETEIEAINYQ